MRSPLNIVLIPRPNEITFAKRCKLSDVITSPITKDFWATPTYYNRNKTKPTRTLTKRQSQTLETQVGAVSGGNRSWNLSYKWISWMMGYPTEYLDL